MICSTERPGTGRTRFVPAAGGALGGFPDATPDASGCLGAGRGATGAGRTGCGAAGALALGCGVAGAAGLGAMLRGAAGFAPQAGCCPCIASLNVSDSLS